MTPPALIDDRLRSHRLSAPAPTVRDAAAHMLAVQSQDLLAGRWALAARTRGAPGLSEVDAALARGDLVRAWTMRGTLHIIPARDLRWVLSVTADRQLRQAASRHRELGIDQDVVGVAERALRPRLRDGGVTRAQAFTAFEDAGIDPRGQRGVHLLSALTIGGVLCQGPLADAAPGAVRREQRFVLTEDHITESAMPDDPLAEFFVRYIDGHGPASTADFAWWSGLTLGTAREAAERARARLTEVADGVFVAATRPRRSDADTRVRVLAAFDEYYISYADRTGVCAPEHLAAVGPGKNGMVRPTVLVDGQVAGVWSPSGGGTDLFGLGTGGQGEAQDEAMQDAVLRAADQAVQRYRAFLAT
jgi:hypothetical protein